MIPAPDPAFEEFYATVSRAVRTVVRAEQRRTSVEVAHRHARAQIKAALAKVCPRNTLGTATVDAEASELYNERIDNLIGAR